MSATLAANAGRNLAIATAARTSHRSPARMAVRRFLRRPAGLMGLGLLAAIVLAALAAPLLAPYDPIEQLPGQQLSPPSAEFILGTDLLGRDVLSRILFGARVSLMVGVVAVALGAGIGGVSGLVAGFVGGSLDAVVMRIWDAAFAVPAVLVGIGFAAAFGANSINAALALGVATMPAFARIARAGVLAERKRDYVQAAFSLGASSGRVLLRHITPNTLGPLLVQVALAMAAAVLLEAGLSFLGLGTQPPAPSWGGMLAEGRQYMRQAPWCSVFPGLAVTLLVISLNFVADALRDALDPRDGG